MVDVRLRLRRWFFLAAVLLAVPAAFEACSSDGANTPSATDGGGAGIPDVSVVGDAWGTSSCATCIRSSTCIGETTRCRAEPTCARHLDCMEACPATNVGAIDPDCLLACPAPNGSAATSALAELDQCRTGGAGLTCQGCGTKVNAFTHPILTQVCTDPNYDAGPDATPVQEVCTKCVTATCCGSRTRCNENPDCNALRLCTRDCTDGGTCIDSCIAQHINSLGMWSELIFCGVIRCPKPCEVPSDPCTDCLYTTCANETIDCQADNDCNLLFDCYGTCKNDACRDACSKDHLKGQDRLSRLLLCTGTNCLACR